MNFWNDIETLERLSWFAPYVFVVLGFVVALAGQFFRERRPKIAPYVFIVLGFVVALFGQVVRSTVDSRVSVLKTEAETARKRTPPDVDAYLATFERTGELLVVMDTKNLVPFRAHWSIVTEKDRLVAGIMLEDHTIHPTEDRKRFTTKANINEDQVANGYIELHFRYESIYSAELGEPRELRREVIKRYRFKDHHVFPL